MATAKKAEQHLSAANRKIQRPSDAAFRRLDLDVRLQIGLGRFFAEKFRAGAAYTYYERTRDRTALVSAVNHYRTARDHWDSIAATATGAYVENLTFGEEPQKRGHWSDRLAAIEADLGDMEKVLAELGTGAFAAEEGPTWDSICIRGLAGPQPPRPRCDHLPSASFRPGESVAIELTVEEKAALKSVRLHCRRVNQAEVYRVAEMTLQDGRYRHEIPAGYSESPFPLIYFFQVQDNQGHGWLVPGLAPDFSNQPYFVVRPDFGS